MKKKLIRLMRKIVSTVNVELSVKIMYRYLMKKKLNLADPKTFNEKINWLKLKVFPKDQLVIKCADKFAVRSYVEEKGCGEYLNDLIGAWDKVDDIKWEELPEKFVLKCNHGCAYNILCKDKNHFDIENAKSLLRRWMKEDFAKVSGEPHYSKIPRKIICEKFLEDEILDYKFFCFEGEPEFFYISQASEGRFDQLKADFFYINGELAEFIRTDHDHFQEKPTMPKELDKMLDVARKLSKDFVFVRVDLFNVGGKIYFSELTFTPSSGMMPLCPETADYRIGQMLDISKYKDNDN